MKHHFRSLSYPLRKLRDVFGIDYTGFKNKLETIFEYILSWKFSRRDSCRLSTRKLIQCSRFLGQLTLWVDITRTQILLIFDTSGPNARIENFSLATWSHD